MRHLSSVSFLVTVLVSLSLAGDSVKVSRIGRRIQLDGLLVDWIEKNRVVWKGSPVWMLDAVNTEDGVAGYFHATNISPACSSWVFKVETGGQAPFGMVIYTSKSTETRYFCVNRETPKSVTVEWLLPWGLVAKNGEENYTLSLAGKSECGDSLEQVIFSGKFISTHKNLPENFTVRLLIIILLSAVFIVLQMKIRKKRPRKGSPRQSA